MSFEPNPVGTERPDSNFVTGIRNDGSAIDNFIDPVGARCDGAAVFLPFVGIKACSDTNFCINTLTCAKITLTKKYQEIC